MIHCAYFVMIMCLIYGPTLSIIAKGTCWRLCFSCYKSFTKWPFRPTHRSDRAYTREVTSSSSCSHWSQSRAEIFTQLENVRWKLHKANANYQWCFTKENMWINTVQELQVLHTTSSIPVQLTKYQMGHTTSPYSDGTICPTHGSRYPQHGQIFFSFFSLISPGTHRRSEQ